MEREIILAVAAAAFFLSCGGSSNKGTIKSIYSYDEFTTVLENADSRLLAFDMYANWCHPCKILTPQLELIAKEHKNKVDFYKVNIDNNRKIASVFQTRNIPHVVFVKNKQMVDQVIGVESAEVYINIINKHGE